MPAPVKDRSVLVERFHTKYVVLPNGCWQWTDAPATNGYGYFGLGSREAGKVTAHKFSYELHVGLVPDGLVLNHVCHERDLLCPGGVCPHRLCVNPAHLNVITRVENINQDRWRRPPESYGTDRQRDTLGRFQKGL